MYNKLPKYVLRKDFKNLFLFSDSEIYYRELFNNNIQKFSKKVGGKDIVLEIMNFKEIKEYEKYSIIKIPNTEQKSLVVLGDIPVILDHSVEDLLGDYFIFDDTKEWEFFVSIIDEAAVFGCNDRVLHFFLDIIQPYKEMTLNEKLQEIYLCSNSEKERRKFIKELCENYKW